MQPQDDRPLWDVLEQSAPPTVSGRFADDVLRRIRLGEDERASDLSGWLAGSWKKLAGLGAMAALLACALVFQENRLSSGGMIAENSPEFTSLVAAVAINEAPDLGDLYAALDDNEIWLGTDSF